MMDERCVIYLMDEQLSINSHQVKIPREWFSLAAAIPQVHTSASAFRLLYFIPFIYAVGGGGGVRNVD